MQSGLLQRDTTALLVIDLQAKLVPAIIESGRVIRNAQLLLKQMRELASRMNEIARQAEEENSHDTQ